MKSEQGAKSREQRVTHKSFKDLFAWQEAHKLYVSIHSVSKQFPKDELFGLTSQIRRASLSVSSNIAEGFGRSSDADKLHFYIMSRGSLYEVQNQLIAAHDTKLLDSPPYESLITQAELTERILVGLINSTRNRGKS